MVIYNPNISNEIAEVVQGINNLQNRIYNNYLFLG